MKRLKEHFYGLYWRQLSLTAGMVLLTLGLLGAYLWRTFDASRRRPPFLIEIADGQNAEGRDREEIQ